MTSLQIRFLVFLSLGILMVLPAPGQDETVSSTTEKTLVVQSDTAMTRIKHSPQRATLYSAALPGLGQAYNKKYWKIPIVYAGFGVLYYFIRFNDNEYQQFKEAYFHSITADEGAPPINEYEALFEEEYLLSAKNFYRRNRDLSYILAGVWYIINIVDAAVDAHLYTWEVDEDLALQFEPAFINPYSHGFKPSGGLKITMRF